MQKALDYIEKYHMIYPGDRVIAGVSGGADSVCLLMVLLELRKKKEFTIIVVHIEHGIRGEESLRDAEYVEKLCKTNNLEYRCIHVNVKEIAKSEHLSEEEAGRKVRYEAFQAVKQELKADKIAVAHNQNDQAETMLWNMVRGSGLDGAAGIRPVRDEIIRPLLACCRTEIEEYLLQRQIPWCVDRTNQENCYTRNIIRNQILPEMEKQLNSHAVEHLAELGQEIRQTRDYLQRQVEIAAEQMVKQEKDHIRINICRLAGEEEFLRIRLIRYCLSKTGCGLKDITRNHVMKIGELITQQSGKQIQLPGGWRAVRQFDEILIEREKQKMSVDNKEKTEPVLLKIPGETKTSQGTFYTKIIKNENQVIPQKQYTKWLNYDRISSVVQVRNREPGDFLMVNRDGGTKKLKAYYIEQKIPAEDREKIPLIACGSEIIWIVGYRISESAKIREHTKEILEIEFREEA